MTARRLVTALLMLCAMLGTGGCTVEGRVEIESVTAADIDVTVTGERSPYCSSEIEGLTTTPGRNSDGVVISCRYQGTVDPTGRFGWALGVAEAGEYLVAVFNPLGVSSAGTRGDVQNQLDAVDVTVRLPGTIVQTNSGVRTGREVRITDPQVLLLPGGLRIVGLTHAGPVFQTWWLAGGVLLGVLGTLAATAWRQRRSKQPSPAEVDAEQADALDGVHRPAPVEEQDAALDPSSVTPDAARAADSGPTEARDAPDLSSDSSIWAHPDENPTPPPAAGDPSRWAPPQ